MTNKAKATTATGIWARARGRYKAISCIFSDPVMEYRKPIAISIDNDETAPRTRYLNAASWAILSSPMATIA